ncbi:MAG TPA: hypothetical protein VMI47_10135, partial [Pseudolabrys sp.]|nr:hypothetical protein [Pseudolabrys sp.]
MHLTAPSNWSRSIGTGGRDPSERVVTIAGMRNNATGLRLPHLTMRKPDAHPEIVDAPDQRSSALKAPGP